MIKYRLICKNCNNLFDSWFASSKEYEKLKRIKHVTCYQCNSIKVEKTLMSPSITSSKKDNSIKYKKIKDKIKKYQKFIKNNFEFVDKNFAYQARSIHYENKKKTKGIYGNATKEEIKELKEEGIETQIYTLVQ